MDGGMEGWVDGWMAKWMEGWMGGWQKAWMGGWMDGWMGGMGKWMDRERAISPLDQLTHTPQTHACMISAPLCCYYYRDWFSHAHMKYSLLGGSVYLGREQLVVALEEHASASGPRHDRSIDRIESSIKQSVLFLPVLVRGGGGRWSWG